MDKIVKMSARKVFKIITVLPIVLFILSTFVSAANQENQTIREGVFLVVPASMIIPYCFWMWAVGVKINQYVPENIRPEIKIFKASFIVFIVMIIIYIVALITKIKVYSIIQLFGMISGLHCIYFISKNLEMAEKNKIVTLGEIRKTFMDVWVLPFGVWKIQPRVNHLYNQFDTHNQAKQAGTS